MLISLLPVQAIENGVAAPEGLSKEVKSTPEEVLPVESESAAVKDSSAEPESAALPTEELTQLKKETAKLAEQTEELVEETEEEAAKKAVPTAAEIADTKEEAAVAETGTAFAAPGGQEGELDAHDGPASGQLTPLTRMQSLHETVEDTVSAPEGQDTHVLDRPGSDYLCSCLGVMTLASSVDGEEGRAVDGQCTDLSRGSACESESGLGTQPCNLGLTSATVKGGSASGFLGSAKCGGMCRWMLPLTRGSPAWRRTKPSRTPPTSTRPAWRAARTATQQPQPAAAWRLRRRLLLHLGALKPPPLVRFTFSA